MYFSLALDRARGSYMLLSPVGMENMLVSKFRTGLKILRLSIKAWKYRKNQTDLANEVGSIITVKIISSVTSTPKKALITTMNTNNTSHLQDPKRSWFTHPERTSFVMVFHEGNSVGKHIDMHFGNGVSLISRITGKPVESEITYNRKGMLTNPSKKAILKHINDELGNHSRFPQNWDHNYKEAKISWTLDKGPKEGYGSGPIREVIIDTECQVMKVASDKSTTELFIPCIDPDNLLYIHKLNYEDVKTPIVIFGKLSLPKLDLPDRLHLKLVTLEKFKEKINPDTITYKEDGAAVHVVMTKKSTRLFSHRLNKDGLNIEYTGKVPEVMPLTGDFQGMGELMFFKNGKELKSTDIGGILNRHDLRPKDVTAKIFLYRADKFNGKEVINLPYSENRNIITSIAETYSEIFTTTQHCDLKELSNHEGFVGVIDDDSIVNGYKYKIAGDENDWKITGVNLGYGPTGNIAGVVNFISTESGKEFKLGPGQLGTHSFCKEIMSDPGSYIGRIAKVRSKFGSEGRSAKLVMLHLDK